MICNLYEVGISQGIITFKIYNFDETWKTMKYIVNYFVTKKCILFEIYIFFNVYMFNHIIFNTLTYKSINNQSV